MGPQHTFPAQSLDRSISLTVTNQLKIPNVSLFKHFGAITAKKNMISGPLHIMPKLIPKHMEHQNAPRIWFQVNNFMLSLLNMTLFFVSFSAVYQPFNPTNVVFLLLDANVNHWPNIPPGWFCWATDLQLQEITLRHRGVLRAVRPWQAHGVVRSGDVAMKKKHGQHIMQGFLIYHSVCLLEIFDSWWVSEIYWCFSGISWLPDVTSLTAAV